MFIVKIGHIFEAGTEGIAIEGLSLVAKQQAGDEVEAEAKRICKTNKIIKEGSCFSTSSGNLEDIGIKRIYHAVISQSPGGLSSPHSIETAVTAVFEQAAREGIKSVAVPGIGIESSFDIENIAILFSHMIKKFNTITDIVIIDNHKVFIQTLKGFIK